MNRRDTARQAATKNEADEEAEEDIRLRGTGTRKFAHAAKILRDSSTQSAEKEEPKDLTRWKEELYENDDKGAEPVEDVEFLFGHFGRLVGGDARLPKQAAGSKQGLLYVGQPGGRPASQPKNGEIGTTIGVGRRLG